MANVVIIGAGITGVTTAYALVRKGHTVTVLDRGRYPGMETSFANGGQLSACNAEVWNSSATVLKGLKWITRRDAPLLLNPSPSLHKYSWLAEFIGHISDYRRNTIATTRLAIAARQHLFDIADREGIEFDLERRGILNVYRDREGFESAAKVNVLLKEGGLDRREVTPEEMRGIEPTLRGGFHGGFYTPSDSTGDIHRFTRGLADACVRLGAQFLCDADVCSLWVSMTSVEVSFRQEAEKKVQVICGDAVVICAGVGSRRIAAMVGDRVNIYPVKGYSITVPLEAAESRAAAPWVSLLDDATKIVSSRLGDGRLRVAGTAEFNGENLDIRADRIEPLLRWTRALFPGVATDKAVPWTGLRPMMPDLMPHVGAGSRPGVYYNTGHGHLGWTLSAATAEIVATAIDSR